MINNLKLVIIVSEIEKEIKVQNAERRLTSESVVTAVDKPTSSILGSKFLKRSVS